MSARNFIGQASVSSTPTTATGVSAVFTNPTFGGQVFNSIDVIVEIISAPTGTSPTLTAQLYSSLDGVNFQSVGSATSSLTAAGRTVLTNNNVDEPFLQVKYVVGGTTPSFPVTTNLYSF